MNFLKTNWLAFGGAICIAVFILAFFIPNKFLADLTTIVFLVFFAIVIIAIIVGLIREHLK